MDSLTEAARWRREAVGGVLEAYGRADGVDAVLVSGSTARGDADRWSDVEVGVFWARPPSLAIREAVAFEVHGDLRPVSGEGGRSPWYDHLYLGAARPAGLLVEVVHTLTSAVEETIAQVIGAARVDGPGMDAIKGIVDGRDARGPRADLVARWQERVREYPRELAAAVVRQDGAIEQFWRWRMLVERDNPLLLAREFTRVCSQVLSVLHALNGRYYGHPSAFKRLDSLERELLIAPAHLAARLRSVFRLPTAEGAEVLRELVQETYDLVSQHLPEVDVEVLRANFRADRQPLDVFPIVSVG